MSYIQRHPHDPSKTIPGRQICVKMYVLIIMSKSSHYYFFGQDMMIWSKYYEYTKHTYSPPIHGCHTYIQPHPNDPSPLSKKKTLVVGDLGFSVSFDNHEQIIKLLFSWKNMMYWSKYYEYNKYTYSPPLFMDVIHIPKHTHMTPPEPFLVVRSALQYIFW